MRQISNSSKVLSRLTNCDTIDFVLGDDSVRLNKAYYLCRVLPRVRSAVVEQGPAHENSDQCVCNEACGKDRQRDLPRPVEQFEPRRGLKSVRHSEKGGCEPAVVDPHV
jgi:hypothetical protein